MSVVTRSWWLVALCGIDLVSIAGAAQPLSDFVAADAALYAEVVELDRDWQAFDDSPFGQRFRISRLYAWLAETPPGQRWATLDDKVLAETGQTLTQRLRGLFARQVGVAVFLPQEGEPQGLLLARGQSHAAMAATIDAWNRLESQARLTSRSVGEATYYGRSVGRSTPAVFYALKDDLFVLSDREALVRDVVERWRTDPSVQAPLSADPAFQSAWPNERGPGTAAVFVSPRRWDRALKQQSDDSLVARALLSNWVGTTAVVGQLSVNAAGLSADVVATFDKAAATDAWKDFVATAGAPPSALMTAPGDAFLVIGGRMSPQAVVTGMRTLMPEQQRLDFDQGMRLGKALFLGLDPWREIGRSLFDDWGVYVVERPLTQQRPLRRHPFVAVWTSHLPENLQTDEMHAALENGLGFAMNLLVVGLNTGETGPEVTLKRGFIDDTSEWRMTGRPESEIALRLSHDRVIISTSTAELTALTPTSNTAPEAASRLARTARELFPHPGLFAWCDLREIRNRDWSRWLLTERDEAGQDERRLRFAAVTFAELLEEMYLAADWSEERLHLQVGGLARTAE